MNLIIVASLCTAILAYGAHYCALSNVDRAEDTKLFGRISWSLIGVIGHGLIAATTHVPHATRSLGTIVALVTIYLVIKAYRLRMRCTFCRAVWVMNTIVVFLAFKPIVLKPSP